MKKYLAILLTLVMAACTTDPDTGGGGVSGDTPEFVTAILGSTYTILGVEYRVEANGDLFVGDTFTYKYNSEYLTGTHAYYTTPDGTGFLGVEIYTGDPKVLSIYLENQLAPWTGSIDDVSFSSEHKLGYISDFVTAALVDSPHTIAEIEYRVDITGDLYVGDTLTYKYVSEKTIGTQAIYTTADGAGFLGVALVEDPKVLAIYLENKTTPWGVDTGVAFDPEHRVGYISDFVSAALVNSPHTIAGIEYRVNAADGHIYVGDTLTYKYVSEKTAGTQAIYTTTIATEFLGVALVEDPEVLAIYLKDKTTPWGVDTDVAYTPRHRVGVTSAFVTAVQALGNFTIFGDTAAVEYTMLDVGDVVKVSDSSVVYTYVDDKDPLRAYYSPVGNPAEFAGIGFPIVEPAPEGVFGFFNRTKAATHVLNLYKNNRLTYWTTINDIDFIEKHLVGSTVVAIPFADWDNYGTIHPDMVGLEEFSTTSFGNNIWIVGGNGSAFIYKSIDAGKTWEKIAFNGIEAGVRSGTVVATSENDLLIMGGNYALVGTFAYTYTSTDGGRTWTKGVDYDGGETEGGKVTKPRRANGAALVYHKGEQYFIGGVGKAFWGNGVWKKLPSATVWTEVTAKEETAGTSPNSFTGTAYHAAVSFKGNLYIIGGAKTLNDVWESTDDGATWTKIVDEAPFGSRTYLSAIVFDNELYIVGGSSDAKSLIWKSTDGVNWTQVTVTTDKIGARQSSGAAVITSSDGTKLDFLIFAGKGKNDTWRTGNYVNPK